jgi:hypothetical protein
MEAVHWTIKNQKANLSQATNFLYGFSNNWPAPRSMCRSGAGDANFVEDFAEQTIPLHLAFVIIDALIVASHLKRLAKSRKKTDLVL